MRRDNARETAAVANERSVNAGFAPAGFELWAPRHLLAASSLKHRALLT